MPPDFKRHTLKYTEKYGRGTVKNEKLHSPVNDVFHLIIRFSKKKMNSICNITKCM